MSFLGLCSDDPLVATLRDLFSATVVLVPEERIRPLGALHYDERRLVFRGNLQGLLSKPTPLLQEATGESKMASLSGKRSRSVQIQLGLRILGNYLGALGLPSAGFRSQFKDASSIAFEFHDVRREFVDIGLLGKALAMNKLDVNNPANRPVIPANNASAAVHLLVIDSVITSSTFTVSVEESKSEEFAFDVPAIQDIIGEAGVEVNLERKTSRAISFEGPRRLTFAFSVVLVQLTPDGTVSSLPTAEITQPLRSLPGISKAPFGKFNLDRILLSEQPGMQQIEMGDP